jgi:hypothetical protein
MKRLCWILILIFSAFAVEAFSKEWNGIVPGVSTRADVEKILVPTYPEKTETDTYKYKKLRVTIVYERKDNNDFNKDVVEIIMVRPRKPEPLVRYIKKIPNFHKDFKKIELPDELSHVNGLARYGNSAKGFAIEVQKIYKDEERITNFIYFAPESP